MFNATPDMPIPAGATEVGDWRLDGGRARSFSGTKRSTVIKYGDPITVGISGSHDRDGSIERYISLNGNHFPNADEAREVIANMQAAVEGLAALAD